jgi:DNA-binding transcriptional LysR family regulator
LPDVLAAVRKARPDFELSLVDTDQRGAFDLLEREEVDLAVCELEARPPAGIRTEVLISMPLVLLLPDSYKIARSGMHGMAVDLPLIRPAADTVLCRLFSKALAKARLDWPARIEVNSLELVHAYVAQGFGSGLSVKAPGIVPPKGTVAWEIPDCPELAIAAAWRGKLTPLAELVLAGLRQRAKAG